MMTIENISCNIDMGQRQFIIELFDKDTNISILVKLPTGKWDRSVIINELIREKYSQDRVEAIINNHFLNIAEWLDKKFKNENVTFEDPEYDELQNWRKQSKNYADMIIKAIEEFIK